MDILNQFAIKANAKDFPSYFYDFILNKEIKLVELVNVYQVYRKYSIIMKSKRNQIFEAFGNSKYKNSFEHQLLLLLIKFQLEQNKYDIKKATTILLKNEVSKIGSEIFNMFLDKEKIGFFRSRREDDFLNSIVNWYLKSIYEEDLIYCEECMSIKVPNFSKLDTYFCSNETCPNSKENHYNSHCWNCGDIIDSEYNYQCNSCKWYICNKCKSCAKNDGCKEQIPIKRQLKLLVIIDPNKEALTLDNIYTKIARKYQNDPKLQRITISTKRGKKILGNEYELLFYLVSYFKMHIIKLREAISVCFAEIKESNRITIYDWGCGQAIGTLSVLENFDYAGRINQIEEINLIEPSKLAAENGSRLIKNIFGAASEVKINIINAAFENIDRLFEINRKKEITLHIFSNILDVEFDFEPLLKAINKNLGSEQNFFICVSPNYKQARIRIENFTDLFRKCKGFREINTDNTALKAEMFDMIKRKNSNRIIKRYHKIFSINK